MTTFPTLSRHRQRGCRQLAPPSGLSSPTVTRSTCASAPSPKHLGGTTVRMLACNGSVPGPVLRVQQHSTLVVNVSNDASCHNAAASSRVAKQTLPVRRLRCATAVRAA